MKIPYLEVKSFTRTVSVQVQLSYAANVYLVDSLNYARMQAGSNYNYYGGYYTKSPVVISAPNSTSTRWYLIVENPDGDGFDYRYEWL